MKKKFTIKKLVQTGAKYLVAILLLCLSLGVQAQTNIYNEAVSGDISSSLSSPVLNLPSAAGTYTITGTLTTPSDGQDNFVLAVPAGYEITSASHAGHGAWTFPSSVATFPLGPGNYSSTLNTGFSTGNAWTQTFVVGVLPINATDFTRVTNASMSSTRFRIQFSSAVTGLTASNFSLGGTAPGTSITAVTGSGSIWYVHVNTGSGTGTINVSMNTSSGSIIGNLPYASSTITKTAMNTGTLSTGDIVFSSYFTDGGDRFSFVNAVDIPANETIYFTDHGWNGNSWGTATFDGIIEWSHTSLIPAGTQITITGIAASVGTVLNKENAATGLNLSTSGDQIIAFQGQTNLIAGLHYNVYITAPLSDDLGWDNSNSVSSSTASNLPPGLTTGTNAMRAGTEFDNGKLDCTGLPAADAAALRAYANDDANWSFDNDGLTIGSAFPACASFLVTCLSTSASISPSICAGGSYTSPSTNYTWTTAGTYMDTILNAANCDSIITINLAVNTTPAAPTANNLNLCTGDIATLMASGGAGSYAWYDSMNSSTIVSNTDSLALGAPTSSATYYVETYSGTVATLGPVDNTFGTGGTYTFFTDGLRFDANATFVLDSVTVYPGGAGDIVVNLLNSSNTVIATRTIAVTSAGMQQIPIGFSVPAGTGYQLSATGSTVSDLYRNNAGASYPYTDPSGNVSITGAINNLAGYYYFFYDWKISNACFSPRTAVTVTVDTIPVVVNATTPYCADFSAAPACWTNSGSNTWQVANGYAEAQFWDYNAPATWIYTTPLLLVDAGMNPLLKFDWSHLYSATYPYDSLNVEISTDTGATWTNLMHFSGPSFTTPGAQNEAPTTGAWSDEEISLLAYAGQNIQLRYAAYSDYGPDLFLDNICLEQAPSCWTPDSLVAYNITPTSALMTFRENTVPTPASYWEYAVHTAPAANPSVGLHSGAGGAFQIYSYSNLLTPNTTYYTYVRSVCGPGDTSAWSAPLVFTTPPSCAVPDSLVAYNITPTSFDFSWRENTLPIPASQWEWRAGFAPSSNPSTLGGGFIASQGFPLASGAPGTTYYLYVRSICGSGDTSAWSAPLVVTTAIDSCGNNIYDPAGAGNDYANDVSDTTIYCPSNASDKVALTFTEFSFENNGTGNCYDGLTFYNGGGTSAPVIPSPGGTNDIWCWDRADATPTGTGDLLGSTIVSTATNGCLTVVMKTDVSATRPGFTANVSCAPANPLYAVQASPIGHIKADSLVIDGDGWFHYLNTTASANPRILLSAQLGNTNTRVDSVTNHVGAGTVDLSNAPYVTNSAWHVMNRTWNMAVNSQPTVAVPVRTYYSSPNYTDLVAIPGNNISAHTDLNFFKINNGKDELLANGHTTVTSADYEEFEHGTGWTYSAYGGAHRAEFMISQFSGGGGGGNFNGNGALPVELINFTAFRNGNVNAIRWTTAMEQNNAYFNVQRSENSSVDFEHIGKVYTKAINGNSDRELNYQLDDASPQLGHNYYRLEQVDIDGNNSYSDVIDVIWADNGNMVTIYPNPATSILNVDLTLGELAQTEIKLVDMSGRVVKSVLTQSAKGTNHITLDLSDIATGVYGVQIFENNKLTHVSKVRKN